MSSIHLPRTIREIREDDNRRIQRTIGKKLEYLRLYRAGVSLPQRQLANDTGTEQVRVSRLENGIALLTFYEAIVLCRYFRIPLDYLDPAISMEEFMFLTRNKIIGNVLLEPPDDGDMVVLKYDKNHPDLIINQLVERGIISDEEFNSLANVQRRER